MIAVLIGVLMTGSIDAASTFVLAGGQDRMVERFEALEISKRFEIYNYLYDKSGHPRDTRLAFGFEDKPNEALSYITYDLKSKDFSRFLRYLPIIYSISSVKGYNICLSKNFPILKAKTRFYDLSVRQKAALGLIQFRDCSLF